MYHTQQRSRTYISGRPIKDPTNCIGYCWMHQHPGYLTLSTIQKHDCIGKQCRHFEKFKTCDYWKKLEQKKREKIDLKNQKKQTEIKKAQILQAFRELIAPVEGFAACSIDLVDDTYVIRCVRTKTVYPSIYTYQIEEDFGVKLQLQFIQNNYDIRRELVSKYRINPNNLVTAAG